MPYQYNLVNNKLKREEKQEPEFQTVQSGEVQGTDGGGVQTQQRKETADTPRMADYLKNKGSSYNLEPLKEVYAKAQESTRRTGKDIRNKETDEAFKYLSPQDETKVNINPNKQRRFNDGIVDQMSFDPTQYDKATTALTQEENLRSMYNPLTGRVERADTQQVTDKLASRQGRKQLLQDEFQGQTTNYSEGMQSLDQALAERQGFDTRNLGMASQDTMQVADAEQQAVEMERQKYINTQKAALERIARRKDDVDFARRDEQQFVADTNNLRVEQLETKRKQDEIIREQEKQRQVEAERQIKQAEAKQKEQESVDLKAKQESDYNNYLKQVEQEAIEEQKKIRASYTIPWGFEIQTNRRLKSNYESALKVYNEMKAKAATDNGFGTVIGLAIATKMLREKAALYDASSKKANELRNKMNNSVPPLEELMKKNAMPFDKWVQRGGNV